MKEIKFRAWHKSRKTMFSPEEMGIDQLTLMPDGRGFINVHGVDTRLSQFIPDMVPLQFTGLHDKNGKDIYEGDILRDVVGGNCVVRWDAEEALFKADREHVFIQPHSWNHREVIGNIHENPELLEAKR